MKIREGFVSNSSSSSFVLGLGKVVDLKKVQLAVGHIDGASMMTLEAICEQMSQWSSLSTDGESIRLKCGYGFKEITLPISFDNPLDLYLIINVHNDEGDFARALTDCVYHGEELPRSYLAEQEYLLDLGTLHGVEGYVSTFGAGRNG